MTTRGHWFRPQGFTLIEVILIIAVLAILAAAATPAILQRLMDAKVEGTRTEAKAIYEAVAGKSDQPGSFGFVGDMGRLPASFDELLRPGRLQLFHSATFRNVGMGWNGPYVHFGDSTQDYLRDAFGHPYEGASIGQVRSAGPDGVFGNEDDIVFPPTPSNLTGRLAVTLKRMSAEDQSWTVDPPNYEVRLYYSNNGQQAFLADGLPPFVFDNVPQGLHAIAVIRTLREQMVYSDTIQTFGNGSTRLVEIVFHLGAYAPIPGAPAADPVR
jgi:prepilin-type N-terminal cleavage/methylation domain-containing protein